MSVLGLDVGTTGTKGVVFDLDGNIIVSAYREYDLLSPRPGWQELEPERVWQCVREVLGEVAAGSKADPIQAMAISAQGEACHAVDKDGRCLTNSIVTFDGRTADMPAWWLERISKMDLAKISGMPLHGMYSLNKILWFKENDPDAFGRADKFLCYEDFVLSRLGLEPVISHSLAARTMALDVKAGQWSSEILEIADIDPDLLARPAASGECVGMIPNSVADDIGLPHGVIAAVGGHDQPAGALGAGIVDAGEAVLSIGTVECICPVFDTFAVSEQTVASNLCCYASCTPGLFASIAFNFTGGSLLKWFRDTFGAQEVAEAADQGRDVYDLLCEKGEMDEGQLLALPHFTMTGTPHFDTRSRGALVGLELTTSREAIISALLSGVTYEMKLNLEVFTTDGVELNRLRAVGGGAKSAVWLQRKADIMGLPVAVPGTTEAAALGVAMLAASASGLVDSVSEFASRAIGIERVFEPDEASVARYGERFAVYRQLYDALKEVNGQLADAATE